MKFRDMKIGRQLRLGLGLILAFVMILGVFAWKQADLLWLQTSKMYNHPLQVRRAIGVMEADVERLSRHIRDLLMAQNDQERTNSLQYIEITETETDRQMSLLYDRYLGPREDLVNLHDDIVKWNTLREETVLLLGTGKTTEAEARVLLSGIQEAQAGVVRSRLKRIDDFALQMANRLYRTSEEQNNLLNKQLTVFVVVILLLSLLIFYVLLKGITDPLQHLTAMADEFRKGNIEARSQYVSANEFGSLSAAFNMLADTVQAELQGKDSSARISSVMLMEGEMSAFCRELLNTLIQHTGSQVGAIYLLNETKTDFEHFDSIGLSSAGRASFSAKEHEGEFGAALATRQIQYIKDIPQDTRFPFATVTGDFLPREIITIPILSGECVVAMVSLASVRSYSAQAIRVLNDIWNVMTARLNGVLALRQLREFSDKLEHQNRELDAQKTEMEAQANELTEQNMELEAQKWQLDEANRLKRTFLSNMSHELRTPLNSVIALAGVLNRRLDGTVPQEEYSYLEVIERNGKNLLALINDILDLSRIEAGKEEIVLSRFSVRSLAADVVSMIEPLAREKDIALINNVGSDLPDIRSDISKCRHILQNLVGNAVKFTGKGHVEISAAIADDAVRITVTDTGIGMAAETIRHIFDEFRQADESTTKNYGGTGLGLSIARKYAILLHGSIAVESTAGKGSTFTLTLPLTIDSPETNGSGVENIEFPLIGTTSATPDGNGKQILVVEDNEAAIIQLKDILYGQGYHVQVAKNGREAIAQIAETLPDAVILDLMMPEVDGFQVLQNIRGIEKTALIPVLILTAKHVTKEELRFLKGNHIHQLIQKGDINKANLLASVGKMVGPRTLPNKVVLPASRRPPVKRISGKPVILVVEDNPDNMLTARALLQDTNTLIEATDGQKGVELARTHVPDLILMDLAIPVMDGYKALDAIRKDESVRHIPVIAVTASAMVGNREEILKYGFNEYISKPIDEQLLKQAIKEILRGQA